MRVREFWEEFAVQLGRLPGNLIPTRDCSSEIGGRCAQGAAGCRLLDEPAHRGCERRDITRRHQKAMATIDKKLSEPADTRCDDWSPMAERRHQDAAGVDLTVGKDKNVRVREQLVHFRIGNEPKIEPDASFAAIRSLE